MTDEIMRYLTSPQGAKPEVPSSLIAVATAAVAFVLIGYALASLGPSNPEIVGVGVNPILLPNTVGVYPEPLDRFLFLSLTLAVPLVLAGVVLLAEQFDGEVSDPGPIFWFLVCAMLTICAIKGAVPEVWRLLVGGQWLATITCGLVG